MAEYPNLELNCYFTTMLAEPPLIHLPFPPTITAHDIIIRRPPSKIRSKSPNAFFIYRKAFFDQLALLNQRFQMTYVSKLVSEHWKNESEQVKSAYKRIAEEVEEKLNEARIKSLAYPDASQKQNNNQKNAKKTRKRRNCNKNKAQVSNIDQSNPQFLQPQVCNANNDQSMFDMQYFDGQYFYDDRMFEILCNDTSWWQQ
ncbi:8898_t:CDS:1 [Cetraspora pellucida]|uniref:8898_t:CDS:1 n=1 Tax=Cetraspora pellucida TaxID=1433469 RepID=A0A9N8ZBX7_9GLOM|nr:8898_t:CDS:1 [Cetraspora pellucida]